LACRLSAIVASGYGACEPRVLELASGTGCHVDHFAHALPDLTFHPTEYIPEDAAPGADLGRVGTFDGPESADPILSTIDRHGANAHSNVQPAVPLDGSTPFTAWCVV